MTIKKIYINEESGSIYWLEDNELIACPMLKDNTVDLDDAYLVDIEFVKKEEGQRVIDDIMEKLK